MSINLSKQKRDKMIETINKIKETTIDEETLKNLSLIEYELTRKKYGLIWEEHEERVDEELKTQIPTFEEVKEREIASNKNDNFNFLLEGDNLHSLYLLEKTHKSKIDFIYIDPPYNTGNEDFTYNDQYVDDLDGYRHSKWLSFMEKRLRVAYSLLKDDGIICISIDENETSQLKMLCDEIFGEFNRLSTHHIKVRYDNKSLNEDNDWQPVMEYVYIYAKNKLNFSANKPSEEYDLSKFQYEITELSKGKKIEIGNKQVTIFREGEWKIEKKEGKIGLLKETWASGSIVRQSGTAAEFLSKYLIQRKEIDGLNCLYKIDNMGEDGLGYRYVTGPKRADAIRGKFYSGVPLERLEELNNNGSSKKTRPISNYYDYSGDFGNIRHEGGIPFNSGKKPVKLLKELINYHTNKNAIILDFFAGSGSTGQAVLELNEEDNGNRHFILCTNNENKICEEITYKRLSNILCGTPKSNPLKFNLKYYKTSYIPRLNTEEENIQENLLLNIKNLIQLENGISIDDKKIRVILTEEEIDRFSLNENELTECEKIYISSDILLTLKQEKAFRENNIEVFIIPEYYFEEEIKEVL